MMYDSLQGRFGSHPPRAARQAVSADGRRRRPAQAPSLSDRRRAGSRETRTDSRACRGKQPRQFAGRSKASVTSTGCPIDRKCGFQERRPCASACAAAHSRPAAPVALVTPSSRLLRHAQSICKSRYGTIVSLLSKVVDTSPPQLGHGRCANDHERCANGVVRQWRDVCGFVFG